MIVYCLLLGEFVCRVCLSLLSSRCQNGNYEMMGEQMIGYNACAAIARHFEGHGVNHLAIIGIERRQQRGSFVVV